MGLGTRGGKVLRGGGCLGVAGWPRGPGVPRGPRVAPVNHVLGVKFRRKLGSRAGISPAGQRRGQSASIGVSPHSTGAADAAGVPAAVVDACSVFLTGIIFLPPHSLEGEARAAIGWGRVHVTVPRQWQVSVRVKAIKRPRSPLSVLQDLAAWGIEYIIGSACFFPCIGQDFVFLILTYLMTHWRKIFILRVNLLLADRSRCRCARCSFQRRGDHLTGPILGEFLERKHKSSCDFLSEKSSMFLYYDLNNDEGH